ncbi:glycosyltransferase family 1 protein [Spirulina sp. CCNP1310]|uniref:glycosyltransferase family 4 protein n=1 Tax=Spirulina sp. CCNP1310 TaxID=3110249 RepID=UPI002B20AA15|nr:glycosyltransferase family 1 protein [Spirulina sp. CCNP1310]MEA5420942.1 glycosyltransferase family 1 protein [Spirulina sp. CCNP1310]
MLVTNLSFLPQQPTGLSVYALNLVRSLRISPTKVLSNQPVGLHPCYPVPPNLSSDGGHWGTVQRLWWLQTELPHLYTDLQGDVFFSPVPEAPLGQKFPIVITVHDLIPLRFPKLISFLRFYFRHYVARVVAEATHVICDSEATAQDLRNILGLSVRNVSVIPLAYDHQHFYPRHLPKENYFLYVGRHDHYKNLGRLIDAFATLADRDVILKIAGGFDHRNTPLLQQQAEALGVGDRVQFLSYVSYQDLPLLIGGAIALVFPSLWEGFGLPVLEAMACGTPVITSNCASLPEVAGDAAILINPYKVGELADAMANVYRDSQLWSHLHQAGLAQAQRFSWQKTADATAEILCRYG